MLKLYEEEANDFGCAAKSTVHPLILLNVRVINSYVLVGNEIVLIEWNPLAPFRLKLELYQVRFRLYGSAGVLWYHGVPP